MRGAALGRHYPGPLLPRRLVANVLPMAALEVRHPMAFLIPVETYDAPLHRQPTRGATNTTSRTSGQMFPSVKVYCASISVHE